MLEVVAAIPLRSELMLEKKSRPVPARRPELATSDVLLVESLLESGEDCFENESPYNKKR